MSEDPAAPANAAPAPKRERRRRSACPSAGFASGLGFFALLGACALTPVPYMLQTPGPVVNTLEPYEGTDLITITGAETHEAHGRLDMLTVAVAGGPGRSVYPAEALGTLASPTQTVVPTEAYYPLETTRDEVTGRNAADMTSSQDHATAAALGELGVEYRTVVAVGEVVAGSAADGKISPDDVIVSVDGEPVEATADGMAAVRDAVQASDGADVVLGVERDGESADVSLTPKEVDGTPTIGVVMGLDYRFPFDVEYNVEGIGGPSAGLVFALTIIDELTAGDLTGDAAIAGTGAIDAEGTVSPIGGARQKVAAASAAGVEYFLSPADNCAEVLDSSGVEDLTVVRVDDLHGALGSVEDIAAGRTDSLPTCPGP